MISGIDIEAWREDEKQTEFLAREKRRADNHVGWAIQVFNQMGGWATVGNLIPNKEDAVTTLVLQKKFWPAYEFRVYEIVKEKL